MNDLGVDFKHSHTTTQNQHHSLQPTNRQTKDNFNKIAQSNHKRMSSLNAVHLNQVVKLTNQKFLSRSPDFIAGNNNHNSDKPVQRRSKSGIEGVFMPNNERIMKLNSFGNGNQNVADFIHNQRASIKSLGGRNDLIESELNVPPRVGKSVITQPNNSLMSQHQTAILQGISSFLQEDNSPNYEKSQLYGSAKLELTSDKSTHNDGLADLI